MFSIGSTNMMIIDMEDIDVDVILGTSEHWQKWRQVGLFEFLLLSNNLLAPLKAHANEFYQSYKPSEKVGNVGGRKLWWIHNYSTRFSSCLCRRLKLMVSKMIVPLHKLTSRLERKPKPLQMVGRWWRLVTQRWWNGCDLCARG